MKAGWKKVPLEALAVQQKGAIKIGPFGSQLKKCDLVTSGIHVVGIENVLNRQFDGLGERFISPEKFKTLATVEIFPGDLLITMMGTIGKVAIVPDGIETSIMDSHLLRIRPDEKLCRTEYLAWAIYGSPAVQQAMEDKAHGAIMQGLNSAIVRSLPIFLPPISEQQRIVGILDEAFQGIATAKANAEKNLQNARALFESHLTVVFSHRGDGWVERPLSAVCDLQNGYAFKSSDYIESSNTLNIRMSSIRPGGSFDPEHNQRFLPNSYAEEYASFLLKEGDLIIAMTDMAGDPKILGVPTLVSNQNGRNFLMNQRVGKLFGFSNDVRVPYLRYFLASPLIKLFYKSKGAGGLQINISKGDILSAQIPLPSIAKQDRIIVQLDELLKETQRLESIYHQKLAALEALKKSLLHDAFRGAL